MIVNAVTHQILCTATGAGVMHDLALLRSSKVRIHPETLLRADRGYQGITKTHKNTVLPHKKLPGRKLSDAQREENRERARARLLIEHVIRRLKVFRILKEVYRHRRKRFGLRLNLLAGLYNFDLLCTP